MKKSAESCQEFEEKPKHFATNVYLTVFVACLRFCENVIFVLF